MTCVFSENELESEYGIGCFAIEFWTSAAKTWAIRILKPGQNESFWETKMKGKIIV